MPNHILTVLFALLTLPLFVACDELEDAFGPPGSGNSCTPGRVVECTCDDGLIGTQRCEDDGERYDACMCSRAEDDDGANQPDPQPFSEPDDGGDPPPPAPDPVPEVDAELKSAMMRVLVVGGTIAAEVNADWSATGADGLSVELQVKSQLTYRAWTPILRNQPPEHFATASLQVTQGERRFDFRIVARDGAGNEWASDAITIQ